MPLISLSSSTQLSGNSSGSAITYHGKGRAPIAPVRTTRIVLEQGVDMVLQVSTCVYARWEWWMHGKEGVCV